jgi:hypothetical protein
LPWLLLPLGGILEGSRETKIFPCGIPWNTSGRVPVTTDIPAVHVVLRKQFPPEQVGKLPRGGAKLDYVGHADVTSRLLEADPEWNWEPLAKDEHGLPVFDLDKNGNPVGLWIRLTAGGVTRLGYGSVPSDQRDAVKVLIGDALRNAAMRFGVALDLWAKGDRADPTAENPSGSAGHVARAKPDLQAMVATAAGITDAGELRKHWEKAGAAGLLTKEIAHPQTGEKMPFQDYLTAHGADLALKSSAKAAPANTRASAGAK